MARAYQNELAKVQEMQQQEIQRLEQTKSDDAVYGNGLAEYPLPGRAQRA